MRTSVAQEVHEAIQVANGSYDAALLACTHYPYLRPFFEQSLNAGTPLFDQGHIVATSLFSYLQRHPEIDTKLKKNAQHRFVTTGSSTSVSATAKRLGYAVRFEEITAD
jgi:glutamate racemase